MEAPIAPSDTPSAGAALNIDDTLARLMVPPDVLKMLLGEFRKNYADAPQKIQALLDQGAAADAEREAHSLKGVSSSLGMGGIQTIAMNLEAAIRDGRDSERGGRAG